MKQNLYKFLILSALMLGAGVIFTPSSAKAALPGEDGVIVTTELQSDPETESSNTAVVTTNPVTGSSQTVATNSNENSTITSATVSAPDGTSASNQTNTIMYAETQNNCLEIGYKEAISLPEYCYSMDTVTYNTVKIDVNGAKVSDITPVATVGEGNNYLTNVVLDMSYSPDSTNAIATRYTREYSDDYIMSLTRVEKVGIDGSVSVVVPATNDNYLNAGYGANGNIYFTMSHKIGGGEFPTYNSDLFMIEAGKTYADRVQVTDTPDYDEVFINVAPDVSKVLVYAFGVSAENQNSYSYVDLTNNCWLNASLCNVSVLLPTNMSNTYLATFSPSGKHLAGVDKVDYQVMAALDEESGRMGVQYDATLNTYDTVMASVTHSLRTISVLYGQFGDDSIPQVDWAPKLADATVSENPVTTVATTVNPVVVAKLANTGVSTYIFAAFAAALIVAGLVTLPKNN